MPLQHSLLACSSSLRIRVVRHPTLRRILHVEACCAVGAVLRLPRGAPVSMFCFARPDRYALVKGDNTTVRRASLRGRAATKLSDTGKTSPHNASLAPLLTLRHCQEETRALPSGPVVVSPPSFCQSRGTHEHSPASLSKVVSTVLPLLNTLTDSQLGTKPDTQTHDAIFSFLPSSNITKCSRNPHMRGLFLSLSPSLSLFVTPCLSLSLFHSLARSSLSCSSSSSLLSTAARPKVG